MVCEEHFYVTNEVRDFWETVTNGGLVLIFAYHFFILCQMGLHGMKNLAGLMIPLTIGATVQHYAGLDLGNENELLRFACRFVAFFIVIPFLINFDPSLGLSKWRHVYSRSIESNYSILKLIFILCAYLHLSFKYDGFAAEVRYVPFITLLNPDLKSVRNTWMCFGQICLIFSAYLEDHDCMSQYSHVGVHIAAGLMYQGILTGIENASSSKHNPKQDRITMEDVFFLLKLF